MTAFLSWIDLIQITIFGLLVLSAIVSKIRNRSCHIVRQCMKRRNELMSDKKQIKLEVEMNVPTTLFNIVKKNGINGLDLILLAFSCGMDVDITFTGEGKASEEANFDVKDC